MIPRRTIVLFIVLMVGLGPWYASGITAAPFDPMPVRPSADPARAANGLAPTPPMGWNSWNRFRCTIDETVIRATADAMVTSGMRDAGYGYVVIDDCWQGVRDANGFITADPTKFPSGIATLAAYIHARGLKFGIYSDAGSKTCGGRSGSQGHEYQDALTYARWGVDYLKYDWCYTGSRNPQEAYALMADALHATGRPIVLSICEWGTATPWMWAGKIGGLWRTTGDISDVWAGRKGDGDGVLDIVDANEPLYPYAGPGHWNDPDMLEVGNGKMTETEYRSHFSLWAMMAAPLIAGNDVSRMDASTRAILTDRDVIAVDQDALGIQGRRLRRDGGLELWVRPLANGDKALLLFNRTDVPAVIGFDRSEIGLGDRRAFHVRNLWTGQKRSSRAHRFMARVDGHGVVMLRITPR